MPFVQEDCVTDASSSPASTTCNFTQVAPLVTYDPGIVLGLAFIIVLLAATFTRNVFYR